METTKNLKISSPIKINNEEYYQILYDDYSDYDDIAMELDIDDNKVYGFLKLHGACHIDSDAWYNSELYFDDRAKAEQAFKEFESFVVAMRLADFRYAIKGSSC